MSNSEFLKVALITSKVGYAESVMCDVIIIRLKRKDERRIGKGNPLTNRRLFMTLSAYPVKCFI